MQSAPTRNFWAIFPQRTIILKHNFACLLHVHIYANLQNFIQLSLTMTKLCHIWPPPKCDHLVNFYISLENPRKIAISMQQYDLHKI